MNEKPNGLPEKIGKALGAVFFVCVCLVLAYAFIKGAT